ncbi:MAG: HD domain-containing protein [Nanoarchaeota archaeon]|nr:HD domain-containing protein [Nanoarchaeota archaeon]
MKEFEQLKKLLYLKSIHRAGEVGKRQESAAEHVYGCMVLAEHFIKNVAGPLDELKVLKLLLYHDLVEIETGDFFILDDERRRNKTETEEEGARRLAETIPQTVSEEFSRHFREYELGKTREAKFAKAIDQLEPMVHWAIHTKDWRKWGFSEENLRAKKTKHLEQFPELLGFFNDLMKELKEKGYF